MLVREEEEGKEEENLATIEGAEVGSGLIISNSTLKLAETPPFFFNDE